MKKTLALLCLATAITACSSGTEYLYKPYSSFAEYGFKDRKESDTTFWLSFTGTKRTTEEQVRIYWQKRASELCQGEYKVLDLKAEMQLWNEQHYSSDSSNTFSRVTKVKKPYMKGSIECLAAS